MAAAATEIEQTALPGAPNFDGVAFPPVLAWRSPGAGLAEALAWIGREAPALLDRAREHGAVLFRDFPVATPQDFDAFVGGFGLPDFTYDESLSNAVRVNVTPRVFTANEAPPEATIRLHHEMAQTPVYPGRLFFFCEKPAESGGATSLCRSDVLFRALAERRPDFAKACAEKGLVYTNVMPPENDPVSALGRSWRSTLSVETQEQAEEKLLGLGYRWQWIADGCLRATTPVLPAVLEPTTGRPTFFNQLIATLSWKDSRNDPDTAVHFGDGTQVDPEAKALAAALAEEIAVDLPWQRRDVALVDNRVTMHGRRRFEGTRRVLASLTEAS